MYYYTTYHIQCGTILYNAFKVIQLLTEHSVNYVKELTYTLHLQSPADLSSL